MTVTVDGRVVATSGRGPTAGVRALSAAEASSWGRSSSPEDPTNV